MLVHLGRCMAATSLASLVVRELAGQSVFLASNSMLRYKQSVVRPSPPREPASECIRLAPQHTPFVTAIAFTTGFALAMLVPLRSLLVGSRADIHDCSLETA